MNNSFNNTSMSNSLNVPIGWPSKWSGSPSIKKGKPIRLSGGFYLIRKEKQMFFNMWKGHNNEVSIVSRKYSSKYEKELHLMMEQLSKCLDVKITFGSRGKKKNKWYQLHIKTSNYIQFKEIFNREWEPNFTKKDTLMIIMALFKEETTSIPFKYYTNTCKLTLSRIRGEYITTTIINRTDKIERYLFLKNIEYHKIGKEHKKITIFFNSEDEILQMLDVISDYKLSDYDSTRLNNFFRRVEYWKEDEPILKINENKSKKPV